MGITTIEHENSVIGQYMSMGNLRVNILRAYTGDVGLNIGRILKHAHLVTNMYGSKFESNRQQSRDSSESCIATTWFRRVWFILFPL